MKIMIKTITVLFLVLFVAGTSYGASAKIGVVDFQKILKNSSAGKAAQADIKKQGKEMEANLKTKGSEIEDLQKQLEKDAYVISREKREEKERDIRIKINDIKILQRRYRDEFKQFEARIIKKIQKDVFELVNKIGKKDGYLLIVEKIGVLYYPESVDITDKVIKEYNARFAAGK